MTTLPETASCASNRLLSLLCNLNVNVEIVFNGSASVVFFSFGHLNVSGGDCLQSNTKTWMVT